MCRGTVLCNSLFDCIEKKTSKIKDMNFWDYHLGTYQTTQNSSIYSTQNPLNNLFARKNYFENYYYERDWGICPKLCIQCDLEFKCISCVPHYKIDPKENKCVEKVKNCNKYDDNDENCIQCQMDYFLALEDNGTFVCQETDKRNEYFNLIEKIIIYLVIRVFRIVANAFQIKFVQNAIMGFC